MDGVAYLNRNILGLALIAGLIIVIPDADSNPTGATVTNGSATFVNAGNLLTITNTPGTIINWNQFNIGATEITDFLQQSSQSFVLNRITGQNGSQILGTLESNGRVILINPNGIVFGKGAVVNVNELVASSLNLSDADFLAGRMNFTANNSNGSVVNQGSISSSMGGSVYLIGDAVTNAGTISSANGKVVLAAGNSVSLTDTAAPSLSVTLTAKNNQVLNLGQINAAGGSVDIFAALIGQQGVIRADTASINSSGQVVLKATQDVDVSGSISADNSAGKGGQIEVLGNNVTLASSASIDASGATGGGTVLVGGALHGASAAVPDASTTTVNRGASIKADAISQGNGGDVVVWSSEVTNYAGSISARGGANGGGGGYVETSGHSLINNGSVDTLAPNGKTGTWLLDPASYCFYSAAATECTSTQFSANPTSLASLDTLLAASNVTLAATNYVAFLPSGASYTLGTAATIPNGTSLTVQSPYIYFGSGSVFNTANVALNLTASNQYGTSTFSGKTGVIDVLGQVISSAQQTVIASSDINIQGASTVTAGFEMPILTGTQSVTAGGNINMTAGAGDAVIFSSGNQTIQAANINITGSSGGVSGAGITAAWDNVTNSGSIGTFTQTVTASGTISITALSSTNANTKISGDGTTMNQVISAQNITLTAAQTGSGNEAYIHSSLDQNIKASSIALVSGGSAAADTGDTAELLAGGNQVVTASTISLTGGGGGNVATATGGANGAGIYAGANQTVTASTSIVMTGGNTGYSNESSISTTGSNVVQQINAGAISLSGGMLGAFSSDGSPTNQTVTANSIILNGVGGAYIYSQGLIGNQTVNAHQITLKAGTTINNDAEINNYQSTSGNQTINLTGSSPSLTLIAGGSAGSYGNDATIMNGLGTGETGNQTITINGKGTVSLIGGSGTGAALYNASTNTGNLANTPFDMTVYCPGCTYTGSSAGIFNWSAGVQLLNFVNGGALTMTGGSQGSINGAYLMQSAGNNTQQIITSSGGPANYPSISMTGGSGGYYSNVTGADLGNDVIIGGDVTIGRLLNPALTINASSITMTGGGVGNTLGATCLGCDTKTTTIVTTGSVNLTGGSNSAAVIPDPTSGPDYDSDRGAISAILSDGVLTMQVGGNLTVTGGNGVSSPAGILVGGNNANGVGSLTVGGTTSLASGGSWVLIGLNYDLGVNGRPIGTSAVNLAPQTGFSTASFVTDSSVFDLNGTINVTGSQPFSSMSSDWISVGNKNVEAEVIVSQTFNNNGTINTPNGILLLALAPGATVTNPVGDGPFDYAEVTGLGYLSAQGNSSGNYSYYLPADSGSATSTFTQSNCSTAPSLCSVSIANDSDKASSVAMGDINAMVTVVPSLTMLDIGMAPSAPKNDNVEANLVATTSTTDSPPAQTVVEHTNPRIEDEKKSVDELRNDIKNDLLAAKKLEADSKISLIEAKTKERDARLARIDADKVQKDALKSVADAAKSSEYSDEAASKSALAAAKRAGADAKRDDSDVAYYHAAIQKSQASALRYVAESRQALIVAKTALTLDMRELAEQRADNKRISSERELGKATVLMHKTDLVRSEAAYKLSEHDQKMAEADQHEALRQVNKLVAQIHQMDVSIAKTESGPGAAKVGGDIGKRNDAQQRLEKYRQVAADKEASVAQKAGITAALKARHDKEVSDTRVAESRMFAAFDVGAQSRSDLGQIAIMRHELMTENLKSALNVLEKEPTAADLPACGSDTSVLCIPAKPERSNLKPAEASSSRPVVAYLPQIQHKIAVLIGNNKYSDDAIESLDNAVSDVKAVGQLLADKMGYETHLLTNASKAEIIHALNEIGRTAGPNDSVAIYYAGHGYLQEKSQHGFWIPSDASSKDPKTWVSNGDIARLLNNIEARQLILMSDSCYSGKLAEEQKINARTVDVTGMLAKRAVMVMTSGGEEPVADDGKEGHSIFAWTLLDRMKSIDQFETGVKLFDSVRKDVTAIYPQVPQYGAALSARHALGADYLFEVRNYQ